MRCALVAALSVAACPEPQPGATDTGSSSTTTSSAGDKATLTSNGDTTTLTSGGDTPTITSGGDTTTPESTDTGPEPSTGPASLTDTGLTATDSTAPETASDTGTPGAACGNGIVEPPELCATAKVSVAGGPVLTGLVVADFTDDGEADVAVLSRRDLVLSQPATVQILAGDPVDGLMQVSSISVGDADDHRGGVRPGTFAADFDQDGRVDLAFIDDVQLFNGLQAHLRVWLNQGDATFEPAVDLPFEPFMKVLSAVGDFDGDGLADVVTVDPGALQVRPGSGDGSLAPPLAPFAVVNVSWLRAAKLDGDVRSDLLVVRKGGSAVLLAQPGGGFVELPAPTCTEGDLEHDIDADGQVDLVCRQGGVLTVHLGLGDGTFDPPIESKFVDNVDLPSGAIGDFDGDGKLDAIATIYNDVHVARGNGDGSFGPLTLLYEDPDFDAIGPRYGVGLDVNKDGVHDLLRSKSAGTTFTLVFSMSAP